MEPKTSTISDVDTKVVKFRSNKVSVASQRAVHVEMQDYMPHSTDSAKKVEGIA